MTKVIAKIDFSLYGEYYFKGDEVKASYEDIMRLNEKGYIEPLSLKELQEIKNPKKEEN